MLVLLATTALLVLGSAPEGPAVAPPRFKTDPPVCLPTEVPFPADATGPAPEAITVRFGIGDDGGATDVSIGFPAGIPVSEILVEAARQLVENCTWIQEGDPASDPAGRRVALRLPVTVARGSLRGLTPPQKTEDDCFTRAFTMKPFTITKRLTITAKFAVFADGKPGRVRLLERFDDPAIQSHFERAVTAAVRACEWIPGKDGSGRPTLVYVVLPIRIN